MKVLVSAYACEANKGSEPGVGWNWVKQIARYHEVWVITRANNRERGGQALTKDPCASIHWTYLDLPGWTRCWKKGQRGVHLYYYLWQIGVYFVAKRLCREIDFDIAHHVTFGSYWLPSTLALLPLPFVWGPLGGAESAPKQFYKTFSFRGRVHERLRELVKRIAEKDRLVWLCARKAALSLAKASETATRLRRLGAKNVILFPESGITPEEFRKLSAMPIRNSSTFRLVSIGRILHWKGFHLGLMAFARFHLHFPDSEYWVIGEGPERQNLQGLARLLGVGTRVRFWGSLPRQEVLERLADCDALVHPSLHDSGGWVCLEAMAAGRPVICLDLGGPSLQVTGETGFKVPAISCEVVVKELADKMARLAADPALRERMGKAARNRVRDCFDWDKKGESLRKLYQEIGNR